MTRIPAQTAAKPSPAPAAPPVESPEASAARIEAQRKKDETAWQAERQKRQDAEADRARQEWATAASAARARATAARAAHKQNEDEARRLRDELTDLERTVRSARGSGGSLELDKKRKEFTSAAQRRVESARELEAAEREAARFAE